MQQSSATPKNQDVGSGLGKILACSIKILLAVPSCFNSFWYGVMIFTLVSLIFSAISMAKTQ